MRLPRLGALALLAVLAGCGSERSVIEAGGRVAGENLTVYSSLPDPGVGVARDMVDAQKLAIAQAGGRAGGFGINFVSIDEGAPGADEPPKVAGDAAEQAIRDPQVIAVIGALRSDTAMTSLPLFNAAGVLLVSPGASYPGLTMPVAAGGFERYYPSGRPNFARLIEDDVVQAATLLQAARRAGGPRVAVEAEAGEVPETLAAALEQLAGQLPEVTIVDDRPDAVIYAGTDLRSAAGVADALAREHPRAALVFGDELTRAGLARRLTPAARGRAIFVSSAPEPGSTPGLRAFEAAFEAEFGRAPDPYAVLGWHAMRRVLDAVEAAGPRANLRRVVIERLLGLPRLPHEYTAFRVGAGGRAYLQGL